MAGPGIIVQEAGTFQSHDISQDYFVKYPSDNRFVNVSEMTFDSQTVLAGAKKLRFVLPAFSGPFIYLLQHHFLSLKLRMVLNDGSPIPNIPGAEGQPGRIPEIAPVNNIVNSCFSSVRVQLNNYDLNPSTNNYPWKAYIADLLSYSVEAKDSYLTQGGWYEDLDMAFEYPTLSSLNTGFESRRHLFLTEDEKHFSTDPIQLCARLHIDLESMTTGILPGIETIITCNYASDDLRLLTSEKDWNEVNNVTLQIVEAQFVCPVGELHPKVWENLEHRITSKEQALIHYVMTSITTITIPTGSNSFDGPLFPTAADLPNRIFAFILDNEQLSGDRFRNPFLFRRKFVGYKADGNVDTNTTFHITKVSVKVNGNDISGFNEMAEPDRDNTG